MGKTSTLTLKSTRHRDRSSSSLVSRQSRSRSNSHLSASSVTDAPVETPSKREFSLDGEASTPTPAAREAKRQKEAIPNGTLGVVLPAPHTLNHTATPLINVPSIHDEEIKSIKNGDDSGFLSSIFNAINSSSHSHEDLRSKHSTSDKKSSFINKLDSLIKTSFGEDSSSKHKSHDSTASTVSHVKSHSSEASHALSASNVRFSPIRDSPMTTLGNGDLSLDDFKDSRKDPVKSDKQESEDPMDSAVAKKSKTNADSEDDSDDEDFDYSQVKLASEKRNKDFHSNFKKVPKQERLIDDYSCAMSKDILVQGRMYLSEHCVCFKSNILGWVTNVVIPLQEVIQIEKKTTAGLFPNGMIIHTLYQNYTFATFINRDSVFTLLTTVWHHVLLENTDKVRPHPALENDNTSDSGQSSHDETSSVNENEDHNDKESEADDENEGGDETNSLHASESSQASDQDKPKSTNAHAENDLLPSDDKFKGLAVVGPSTHGPTESGFSKDSSETLVTDETFSAPMGAIFNLLFGKDPAHYIKILKEQKNFDISESDISELSNEKKTRNYKYTKPLSNSLGPKQATCLLEDKIVELDFDKCIIVEQVTQTPDVPSGNAFKTHTKIVLSWGENNSTRFYVVTSIVWSGKSWVKSLVEKGSIDGQMESMKVLVDYINGLLSSSDGGDLKKKRSRKKSLPKKAKEEVAAAPPTEKTFGEKLNDLIEDIGKAIPVQLPVSQLITGYMVLFLGLIVFLTSYNLAFHGKSDYKVKFGYSPVTSIPMVNYNNQQYIMFPTVDTSFRDQDQQLKNEVDLWNWVQEKSGHKIRKPDTVVKRAEAYGHQEIEEVMRLTKLRLAELSRQLQDE